ncbi:MAG: nucleotidyltransferase domain-containing protein [Candidatus Bathycorpusculaceae bacterium]
MLMLPEKIRRTLEKIVKETMIDEEVYGIGLFGSWSRGDATASSDVDLLILDATDFAYEYVERKEISGLPIDLNHVPKKWLSGLIPPEIDQKLYEVQILYDRDWSLANAKLLMAKSYSSPERVDIRTESHIVDSDIYLSRATSALSKGDFPSASIFAATALESMMKVLVEIALEPFSNSRMVEKFEVSTAKLGVKELFNEYMRITALNTVDNAKAKDKLKLFKIVWDAMHTTISQNPQGLEHTHFKVKTKLKYYLNPAFLQGFVARTTSLIEHEKTAETSHYIDNTLIDLIENYAWFKVSTTKTKMDYTTLISSLERLEAKNPKNFANIIKLLNLGSINEKTATEKIERTRQVILKIREQRKILIKNHLLKS